MTKLENVGRTVIEEAGKKYLVTYKNAHELDWYEITNNGYQHMLTPPSWYFKDEELFYMSIINKMRREL